MTRAQNPPARDLYWEMTTSCQLACQYCFYESGTSTRRHRFVQKQDVERLLDAGLAKQFRAVALTGGEALLLPGVFDIIALIRHAELNVSLITDGIRLDSSCVSRLSELGVSRVAVSLDSLMPATNDDVRLPIALPRGQGAERIIRHLRDIAADETLSFDTCVLQTVHRRNIEAIRPMIRFCRDLGLDLLVHPVGLPRGPSFNPLRLEDLDSNAVDELWEAMVEWATRNPLRLGYAHAARSFIRGERPNELTCPMGRSSFFLDANGNLSPCFHRQDLTLGNVRCESLDAIIPRASLHDLAGAPCAHLACACLLDCSRCVAQPHTTLPTIRKSRVSSQPTRGAR
ncbi:MAG: radical SAM protein [Dehalococcoidia bacterium]|nr:radical SAM protein [Dehalococcoidia bacterium]